MLRVTVGFAEGKALVAVREQAQEETQQDSTARMLMAGCIRL